MEILFVIFGILLGVICTTVISTRLIERFYYVPAWTFLSLIMNPNNVITKCIERCVGYETNLVSKTRNLHRVFYIVNPSSLLNLCMRWIDDSCSILYRRDNVYIYRMVRGVSTGLIYIINPAIQLSQMIDGEFVNEIGVIVSKNRLLKDGRVYKSFKSIKVFRPDTKFHPLKNKGVNYRKNELDCRTFLTRKLNLILQR